jgi:hypothetical protein
MPQVCPGTERSVSWVRFRLLVPVMRGRGSKLLTPVVCAVDPARLSVHRQPRQQRATSFRHRSCEFAPQYACVW